MEFAKKVLKKYGWKEGDGLGKNNNGISEPLRAKLKFDTAGLGVDKAAEFKDHWWERVFNDAASNIDVSKAGENVEIAVKNNDSVEITTKMYSARKLKKGKNKGNYKNFLKKSVLNGSREKPEVSGEGESDPDVEEFPKYKSLTDEELFAACGGRTAHKGARHGLNLTGKLSRIEKQEQELLKKMQENESQSKGEWTVVKSKKKRKREDTQIEKGSGIENILFNHEYHVKSKKKKKKEKRLDSELSVALNSVGIGMVEESKSGGANPNLSHKRKKPDLLESSANDDGEGRVLLDEENSNHDSEEVKRFHSKKKKKCPEITENVGDSRRDFLKSNAPKLEAGSKKKKRKLQKCIKNVAEDLERSLALA